MLTPHSPLRAFFGSAYDLLAGAGRAVGRAVRWAKRRPPIAAALLVCLLAGLGAAFVGEALRSPEPPMLGAEQAGTPPAASPPAVAPAASPPATTPAPTPAAPKVTPPEPLETAPQAASDFDPPVRGRVTATFGWRRDPVFGDFRFHPGLDLAGRPGDTLTAAAAGKVTGVRRVDSDYGREPGGWEITVQHPGEWSTRYRFGGDPLVAEGRSVRRGEPLATLDQSARLHYALYRGDAAEAPPRPNQPGE